MGVGPFRLEANRRLELRDSLYRIAFVLEREGQVVVREGILGFKLQCLAVIGDGLVPGFVTGLFERLLAVILSRLRETRRCNDEHQKQQEHQDYSLACWVQRKTKFCLFGGRTKIAGEAAASPEFVTFPNHQINFPLTCPMRGSRAFVMFPKL